MTEPFDLGAFEQRLQRQGAPTFDDVETLIAELRSERERREALEQECAAYAERDLMIQAVMETSGRVEGVTGPSGRVAHVTIPALARVLAVLLIKPDGTLYNYIEWDVGELPQTGPMALSLQRVNGKTPGMIVNEAHAERDAAQADNTALRDLNTQLQQTLDMNGALLLKLGVLALNARAYRDAWAGCSLPMGPLAIGERWQALKAAIDALDEKEHTT